MRRWSLAFVVVAACSTPQTIVATKDPATFTLTPTATGAIDAARTLRFAFVVSREISCSQSFETETEYGSYVLTLTPPHGATLVLTRVDSTIFGSSYDGPGGPPPTRTETRSVSTFEGTVGRAGDVLSFSLERRKDECGKDGACGAPLSLSCQESVASVVTFDAKGKHVGDHAIVRCTPSFGLPPKLAEGGWKGGLAFADGSGLTLEYEEYGPMEGPPELRPTP